MRSNQRFMRYRTHKLFGQLFFQNVLRRPSRYNVIFPKGNQIIRDTQRTTTSNLNATNQRFIRYHTHKLFGDHFFKMSSISHLVFNEFIRYRTHKLFGGHFFKMSSVSHLVFNEFPKINQIIRNTQRTSL